MIVSGGEIIAIFRMADEMAAAFLHDKVSLSAPGKPDLLREISDVRHLSWRMLSSAREPHGLLMA